MTHLFLLIILSTAGLILSIYINQKKNKKQKLVCVIGQDCDKVIRSKYGKTFGIENTLLGILYFLFILAAALLNWAASIILPLYITFTASAGSAAFSAYLTGVQLFVLKEWCEYCLAASGISIAIFLLVLL